MAEHSLYIVFGTGADSVGLVGKITGEIAGINGNIVDMRQDVMHGLFTIFLVVDLSGSTTGITDFSRLVEKISLQTNLTLKVDKYFPVPRKPDIKNMLLILLGNDRPGIIAAISEKISKYNINIEFSRNIAREGIFLMELLTDISGCTLPMANLKSELSGIMKSMNISTMFQTEDVFNKKKRVIVFNFRQSFIPLNIMDEILKQTEIKPGEMSAIFSGNWITSINNTLLKLDELPADVLYSIIDTVVPTPATLELIQTLKIMGYKIALVSNALSYFTDSIKKKLGLDFSVGFPVSLNSDTKALIGVQNNAENIISIDTLDIEKITGQLIKTENVNKDEITIINDNKDKQSNPPGLGLEFNMKQILDYYNQHVLTRENLIGILGSFGVPVLR